MSTELWMRKVKGKLEAANQIAADDMARIPSDKDLLVIVKAPKNAAQMRFIWALAGKIADARDDILDKEVAMDVLCEMARHVKIVVNPITGKAHIQRKSLSALDQAAMSRLIDRMVYVTCTDIIPGLDPGTLRDEIEAMCAGNPQRQREREREYA